MEQINGLNSIQSSTTSRRPAVHLEIQKKVNSTARSAQVKEHVSRLLQQTPQCLGDCVITKFDDTFLQENVTSISICDPNFQQLNGQVLDLGTADVRLHVFQLQQEGPSQEELDEEDIAAANHWLLPSADLHGLWESLVFDSEIKQELLQYASTTLLFSDRRVDTTIISWNRVLLLHGPPGTGKTTLCKALAQKLCIHLSDRYMYGQLIEINSHSLFSKWFSESGKLVMKMFQKIQELLDDKDALVFVLIDEVESLTAARKAAMQGTEPSDAIRVVNALLTQLDQIKKNPNVMILTTSNITGAIDLAFVDRADIKQYIGPPSPAAIYQIYESCISELMKAEIIKSELPLLKLHKLDLLQRVENSATRLSVKLKDVAVKSEGLSGRTLRKLPFVAHALYVQTPTCSLDVFLDALSLAVDRQFAERKELGHS